MDSILKRLPDIWEILGRRYNKNYSLQLFSDGPRGASDHRKGFKNENFRQFAIGAMPLVSLRVGLSEKLWRLKHRFVVGQEDSSKKILYYSTVSEEDQRLILKPVQSFFTYMYCSLICTGSRFTAEHIFSFICTGVGGRSRPENFAYMYWFCWIAPKKCARSAQFFLKLPKITSFHFCTAHLYVLV